MGMVYAAKREHLPLFACTTANDWEIQMGANQVRRRGRGASGREGSGATSSLAIRIVPTPQRRFASKARDGENHGAMRGVSRGARRVVTTARPRKTVVL